MKILSDVNPLEIFCKAGSILEESVVHTLGPNGTNTAIINNGHYDIINDGKSIIENLTSTDEILYPAIETLKQSSFETNRKAGDGTTSTIVMTNTLLQACKKYLDNHPDVSRVQLRKQLEESRDLMLDALNDLTIQINEDDYTKIATVALGSDKYSEMIADIFKFLDKGQRPTLLKSNDDSIVVEKIDGINLDKCKIPGNLFPEGKEFSQARILCLYSSVNRFNEITQLLKKCMQSDSPVILFYNQMSVDVLENILFNYSNGALNVIPVCLGGYGKGTYTIMKDIAEYVEGVVIDDSEIKINEISKISLSPERHAILNKENITIKNSEKVSKNYLHLKNKSVIIRLGGTNIVEREEVFKRVEDAINSLGNAIEYGIVLRSWPDLHQYVQQSKG